MCAALKVTRQGYYAWKSRPLSAHAMRDEELAELISQVRAEVRGIYGAPKAFFALRRMGVRTSMKRVARIMRERGWRGVTRACAKRPSGEKRAAKRESAEDLVKRKFSADGPNMAWFADITYVVFDTVFIARMSKTFFTDERATFHLKAKGHVRAPRDGPSWNP